MNRETMNMDHVETSVEIHGSLDAVFDLVTMARYWPRWHPATRGIGGVVERPYQLGDLIHEVGEIGGVVAQVTWRVAEHERPARVVLEEVSSLATITYTFDAFDDDVLFRRRLEYDESPFQDLLPDRGALRNVMREQSEEGLRRLKELVENILRLEEERPS